MNKNLTELVYIIDMSGSMDPLKRDTIGGYNSLLDQQRKLGEENKDLKANVTTVLFDDRYILLHDGTDIKDVKNITEKEYAPLGMTAMLDAIGRTLNALGQKIDKMAEDERPGLVSVTIITDGYENASKEFTWDYVKKMIKERKEKDSWLFSFIGANIEVADVSENLGIDVKMSKKFTATGAGAQSVFASVSRGASQLRFMKAKSSSSAELEKAMSEALDDIQ